MEKITLIIETRKKLLAVTVILAVAFLIYNGWLKEGVIARTDIFHPSMGWMEDNLLLPQAWKEEGGGHVTAVYEAHYYLYYLWSLATTKLGLSIDSGRRLIWVLPFFIGLFSMYSLSRHLFGSLLAASISSVYFISANMTVWAAHASWLQGISGLSLSPFALLFFMKALSEDESPLAFARHTVLTALVVSVIVWYDMKIAMLAFALLAAYGAFRVAMEAVSGKRFPLRTFLKAVAMLAAAFLLPILLNLHAVLPNLLGSTTGAPAVTAQPAYLNVSGENNLLNALLFTYSGVMESRQAFPLFLSFISAAVFLSVVLQRKDPTVIFLAAFSVLLIFLAKHTAPPFPKASYYLFKYMPGYIAFKDPTKFVFFLGLPSALLLGAAASGLASRFRALVSSGTRLTAREHVAQATVALAFIVIITGAVAPFFAGRGTTVYSDPAGSALIPREMPHEYRVLYDEVEKDPEGFRTLIFPGKVPFSVTSAKHPFVYGNYYNQPPLLDLTKYLWVREWGHAGIMSRDVTTNMSKLTGLFSVKKIVVAPEKEAMWNIIPNEDRGKIVKALEREPGLERIDAGTARQGPERIKLSLGEHPDRRGADRNASLIMFGNRHALPPVFSPAKAHLVVGGFGALVEAAHLGGDFSSLAFFFSSQLKEKAWEVIERADGVFFTGAGLDDLVLASVDAKFKIDAWEHTPYATLGFPTDQRPYDYHKTAGLNEGWIRYFYPYWTGQLGEIAEGAGGLVQSSEATPEKPLVVEFDAPLEGRYGLWLRSAIEKEGKGLSVYLDEVLAGHVRPGAAGLRWLRVAELDLTEGIHTIKVFNRGGVSALDLLAIVPLPVVDAARRDMATSLKGKEIIILLEAERDFERSGGWTEENDPGLSMGSGLKGMDNVMFLSNSFDVPCDGQYTVSLRASTFLDPERSELVISIDGKKLSFADGMKYGASGMNGYWIVSEPVFLEAGRHETRLYKAGEGTATLDIMAVYNTDAEPDKLFYAPGAEVAGWKMNRPTSYAVEIEREAPGFIVLNQNFHSSWEASLPGGRRLEHFQVNGWANAFYAEKGEGRLAIKFGMQRHAASGFYISASVLGAAVVFLLMTGLISGGRR